MLAFDEQATRLVLKRVLMKTPGAVARNVSGKARRAKKKIKGSNKKTPQPSQGEKMRVLCLHGYEQNTESFRKKTGSLRRAGKKHVEEFYFLQGPHKALQRDGADAGETPEAYAWYLPQQSDAGGNAFFEDDSQPQESSRSWSLPLDCDTWNASLGYIGKCFQDHGPFDGVLGFSQGAAMAAALCRLQQGGADTAPLNAISFRFVCLLSGFCPSHGLSLDAPKGSATPLTIPSLHIGGAADEIIRPERSKGLAMDHFDVDTAVDTQVLAGGKKSAFIVHSGGHLVPSEKHIRDQFKEFLGNQRL
jgi:hypothetical protein